MPSRARAGKMRLKKSSIHTSPQVVMNQSSSMMNPSTQFLTLIHLFHKPEKKYFWFLQWKLANHSLCCIEAVELVIKKSQGSAV